MAYETGISWTEATWNPFTGCHKISTGCKNCYMFTAKARYGQDPSIVVRSKTTFDAPLKWKEPKLIFTCSWSDFFISDADKWRDEAWNVIRATPRHTYQVLTKRPERIAAHLPADWGEGWPNVWLGVSVEDQEQTWRIPYLIEIPAKVLFLSCEPLLSAIDLHAVTMRDGDGLGADLTHIGFGTGIDWVIVGGESGPSFRPLDLDHARSLRDQCVAAGIPFFYKQGAGLKPGMNTALDGVKWRQMPGLRQGDDVRELRAVGAE